MFVLEKEGENLCVPIYKSIFLSILAVDFTFVDSLFDSN